jgi:DNA polymerase-3 subunit delta
MRVELIDKQLKTGDLEKLYLLYGDEDYIKSYYCGAIAKKAVSGMESFNLHKFDGDSFNLSLLEAAIDNLPLMSERKCIILRDIDPDGLRIEDWKELQKLLKAIPKECVLVFCYLAVKYDKKSSRWKTLIGIAQKAGLAVEIGKQQKKDLVKWLVKKAGENSCTLSTETAEYLINTCGEDMTLLSGELEKLCAFAAGGEISKTAVNELASKPLDASIYDLARAVTDGRTGYALNMIDELFDKKEEPVVILSALSGAFCDLFRAKTALLSGVRQTELENDFNYRGREFRIRNAIRDCAGLEIEFLRGSLGLLMRTDESLKSTRIDKRVILERLVVEMAALRKRVQLN